MCSAVESSRCPVMDSEGKLIIFPNPLSEAGLSPPLHSIHPFLCSLQVLLSSLPLTACSPPCSQLTTLCASSTPKIRDHKRQDKNIPESLGKALSFLYTPVLKHLSHSFMCWRHFINILINTNRRVAYFHSSGDIY